MDYKNHFLWTLLLSLILFFYLEEEVSLENALWIIIACGASLLPDLDTTRSKATQFFDLLAIVSAFAITTYLLTLSIISIIATIILFSLYKLVMKILSQHHRGNFHTVGFGIIIAIPIYLYSGVFLASSVFFGIFAHLVEDTIADITGIGRGGR